MRPTPTTFALLALLASAAGAAASCDESMTGFFDSDIKSQAWTDIAHGNVRAVKESLATIPATRLRARRTVAALYSGRTSSTTPSSPRW